MSTDQRPHRQRGQSTVEMLVAAAILAVAAQATALVLRQASKSIKVDRDRAYATDKALQMLEELRAEVMDESSEVSVLDIYDDNSTHVPPPSAPDFTPIYKYTLTTERNITFPQGVEAQDYLIATAPLSANPIRGAQGYAFVRNVRIERDPLDSNLRRIRVRVFAAAPNAGKTALSTPKPLRPDDRPLAEVLGTVRSLGSVDKPAQVLDYFLVAIENVPGWWSRTSNLIPLMQASIVSMQARNPGLKIRPHWISRLSYGRDVEYTPEINDRNVVANSSGAFQKAYVYPGLINYSDGNDEYYSVSWFKGRLNIGGTLTQNQGYPMADQFNQPMRLPDEEKLYNIMCTIAANNGEPTPEISLRQLLDRLNSNDPSVQNAIVVNLHGEMLPAPPLRNYSDAAKDPLWAYNRGGGKPARNWRVVSHFERIGYDSSVAGQNKQAFRVYAYDMNPPEPNSPITVADEEDLIDEVTVFVPGASIANNLDQVQRWRGNSHNPYKMHSYDSSNWVLSVSPTAYQDGPTSADSTWIADDYTPPGRDKGLRIRFRGTTPTARVYNGPEYGYYYAN